MHFERGSSYKRAAKYLQYAADNGIRRFAYQDAIALARRGLELIERLPDSPEHTEQKISLQLTLGVPLIATEGYAAPGVGNVYLKARELCQRLGEPPEISQVLWGVWTFHTLRAELGTAYEIAEEFLRLSDRLPQPGLPMRGHLAMEITLAHLGDYAPAVEHFEKALLLYDPEVHRDDAFLYALNPGVAMRCFGAWALWFLGLPDQALNRIQEALSLARELSEPHGLAHALFFAAILHQLRREGRLAQEHAEAAIALAREHGMVMYQALATMTRGWALIEQGWEEEAIEQMRQGLAAHQATGANLMCPHFLALLAEALAKTRQPGEGLHVLEEALEIALRTGERSYEAELYRLKGERLLTQFKGHAQADRSLTDAEDCFNQSIRIAQRQKAKSLELRAVKSAARLYQHQHKRKKARDILAPVYESFTEGFDTPDLREAKTLLAELA